MKRLVSPILIFILFMLMTSKVIGQQDPFHLSKPMKVQSKDILLLWMEDIGGGTVKSYQKVYRYNTEGILLPPDSVDIDTMLTKTLRRESFRPGSDSYIDIAAGRFNIDPYDDAVAVWRNSQSNQKTEVMISNFDSTGFYSNTSMLTIDAGEDINQSSEIYVKTGNFDADPQDEFVVACRDLADSVIFYVYDVDTTLQPHFMKRFCDTKVAGSSLTHFVRYFAETADLNGDGVDELISSTWENAVTGTAVPITIRIYAFSNGTIVPKGSEIIQVPKSSVTGLQDFAMAVAKGQFDSDESQELVFSSVVKSDFTHVAHNYILNISQNLDNITVGPDQYYTMISDFPFFINDITEFGLTTGDLNGNGKDEIVFAAGKNIRVLEVADNYTLGFKADVAVANGGPNDYKQSFNYLKVCDMNMDNRGDIIVVKNIVSGSVQHGFEIAAVTFPDTALTSGTDVVIARQLGDESQNDVYQQYAITVGNFDGFDFTIGMPTLYHDYGIVQPIVILNAPPVHFDKIDGIINDVNACYNGGDCDFWSQYTKQSDTSIEVSAQIHNDWDVSAGAKVEGSIEASPMGVGVSTSYKVWATGNFGLHFSKDTTNSKTITVSVQVQARDDDRIFSTIEDYDIWEYPVFHGNEPFPRRSYFALVPKNVQATWYGSKSYFAKQYIPNHEVGNILSYYPYSLLSNNPDLSQTIRASYSSDRFSLDGSSSYDWNVSISDFQQSGASTERNLGIDAGLELGGFSSEFKFSNKKMTTHKTSVSNLVDLKVHLGNLNMSIGDVKYAVTPYAYWGTNDALVVDYAVEPELSPPGYPATWWQDYYGSSSDPTFVLPWRLDPEKGFALNDPAKRFQTKDINFYPANPKTGDTLEIRVRVRNFSFVPTPGPVTVSFYIDDPDSSGTPIIGIGGTNTVSSSGPVPERGRLDVAMKWVVPAGLPAYPRIYAVLDEQGMIAEIHEDNNKGFSILGTPAVVPNAVLDHPVNSNGYALHQSYPNPFRSTTNIEYTIPNNEKIILKVFDYLGREISTLVDAYEPAGNYIVPFDGSHFPCGVYYYTIHAGNFYATRKMVLMK
jgi:hypothetical protein